MKPGLYRGRIAHRRTVPFEHRFEYAHAMWAIDLADPQGVAHPPLLSVDAPGIASFHEGDYLPGRERSLADEVRARVAVATERAPVGRILLLTQPRMFGLHFNPVSFFLCFDDGQAGRPQAMLAEVRNTPWNERHCYVIDWAQPSASWGGGLSGQRSAKAFHVSPFLDMDYEYAWSLALGDERIALSIANERPAERGGERVFWAGLSLERCRDTRAQVAATLLRQPLGPLGVLARIHWQALRLALRGAPFHPNPGGSGRAAERAEMTR